MVSVFAVPDRARTTSLLADVVDYPHPGLADEAEAVRTLVAGTSPPAAALLERFVQDVEEAGPGRIEELYSSAFDLDTLSTFEATCYPYVGHHLLGETYRRSRFMVELLDRYREHGFAVDGRELPDHLLVMLRFVAHCRDEELAEELLGDAILPALRRMTLNGEEAVLTGSSGRRVYLRVLEAVRLVLEEYLWPELDVAVYELGVQPAKRVEVTG